PPRAFFDARGPWVSADTRPSLRPLRFQRDAHNAFLGQLVPRERWRMSLRCHARFKRASSIPETPLLEPISRGVLDRPVEPGDDG
ncbi:hypothetical protein, partial [Bradyrhizobium sp.]|uniref:hypothetical protein n=1 Tax=Bradyrhizobium sp. TaxID=376 RepID=UPI0025C6AF27